jgi:hypothetical protein
MLITGKISLWIACRYHQLPHSASNGSGLAQTDGHEHSVCRWNLQVVIAGLLKPYENGAHGVIDHLILPFGFFTR